MSWIDFQIGADAYKLYVSEDVKTAPVHKLANAFGMTPIDSCIGFSTPECRSVCYADKLMMRPNVKRAMDHNLDTMRAIEAAHGVDGLTVACSAILRAFLADCDMHDRRNARRAGEPVKPVKRVFRWTWSGELLSPAFASAISSAHLAVDGCTGYLYTRARYFVPMLAPAIKARRLNVMLSTDKRIRADVERFRDAFEAEQGIRLATFGMADETGVTGVACPAIARKSQFPMTRRAGDISPCARCGICSDVERKPIDVVVTIH